jgi:periplasmic protein TonB
MFEDALTEADAKKKARRRWITFPASVALHALIIAIIFIGPLLTADADANRPAVKVLDVFMAAAPPPPPPPPPPAKKKSEKAKKEENKKEVVEKPIQTGRLVAPIEIPDEIPEENISDLGVDFGVDGGVEGGVEGGVVGGVLGAPGSSDNVSQALQIASVQSPRLIKRIEPEFPPVALKAHIQGTVVISAVTDIYGRVQEVKIVNGHPLLKQAVIDAVKQWVYEPYILNGVPRPVKFTVVVHFNLQNR